MGTFTLDTSTLGGDGDAVVSQELTGQGRWTQFEFTNGSNEDKAVTFLGFLVYYTLGGEKYEAGN